MGNARDVALLQWDKHSLKLFLQLGSMPHCMTRVTLAHSHGGIKNFHRKPSGCINNSPREARASAHSQKRQDQDGISPCKLPKSSE